MGTSIDTPRRRSIRIEPTEFIAQNTVILSVSFHRLMWTRQITGTHTTLAGESVNPELLARNSAKLRSPSVKRRLSTLESQVNGVLNQLAPFRGLKGAKIVPRPIVDDVGENLDNAAGEIETFRNWLLANYDVEVVDYNRRRWPASQWSYVSPSLPTLEDISRSYRLTYIAIPIATLGMQLDEETSEFVSRAKANMRECIAGCVDDMVRLPREALGDAVTALRTALRDQGTIRCDTFNSLRRAMQYLQDFMSLPELADEALLTRLSRLTDTLDGLTNGDTNRRHLDLNSTEIYDLDSNLGEVLQQVENTASISSTLNRFGRAIMMD